MLALGQATVKISHGVARLIVAKGFEILCAVRMRRDYWELARERAAAARESLLAAAEAERLRALSCCRKCESLGYQAALLRGTACRGSRASGSVLVWRFKVD